MCTKKTSDRQQTTIGFWLVLKVDSTAYFRVEFPIIMLFVAAEREFSICWSDQTRRNKKRCHFSATISPARCLNKLSVTWKCKRCRCQQTRPVVIKLMLNLLQFFRIGTHYVNIDFWLKRGTSAQRLKSVKRRCHTRSVNKHWNGRLVCLSKPLRFSSRLQQARIFFVILNDGKRCAFISLSSQDYPVTHVTPHHFYHTRAHPVVCAFCDMTWKWRQNAGPLLHSILFFSVSIIKSNSTMEIVCDQNDERATRQHTKSFILKTCRRRQQKMIFLPRNPSSVSSNPSLEN